MSKKVLNKRSNVVLGDGRPKIPTAEQMEYGEIAINYAAGNETISLKNSNNEIVAFSPIETVQTTGGSTTAVMSQNAVTVELNKKANTTDVYTKSEVNNTLNNYSTSTEVTQQITAAVKGKADKATTLAGYGITDAKIEGGTITLGSQTITPLTEATAGDYITSKEVDAKIAALVDSAPGTLDTLNELAAALGDDPNFATTITAQIASKADAADLADYATTEALTSGLAGKANTTHTHTVSQITDLGTTLSKYATTTALTSGLAGKANTTHTHTVSQITDLGTTLSKYATTTALTSGLAGKANTTHTHTVSQITDLNLGNYATKTALTEGLEGKANTSHTHAISDVTNLQNTLNNKAAVTHTHTASQITDLSTTLSKYATTTALTSGLAGKANTSHTHAISDVTNLQNTLNNKAAVTHTHTVSQITDLNLGNYATRASVSQAIAEATFNTGHNTVTSLTNIPNTKRLVIATISRSQTLGVALPADGREINIIVHNTSGSDIIVTIPTAGGYVAMSGDQLTVKASSYADINVVSDGTIRYVRAL